MATIKDVARIADVSVATVSRVINNRGYLSDSVKQTVYAAMKELDYHPNDLARSLHNQRSKILGIIVPTVMHPFFSEVIKSIETQAYSRGFKLMVCNSLQDIEKERDYISMLRRSQVDGIIMGSHLQNTDDYTNLNLPLVTLDRRIASHIPYVCCDNDQGGQMATRYLIDSGCRSLLHFSGPLDIRMLSNHRAEAFQMICSEKEISHKVLELPDDAILDPLNNQEAIFEIIKNNADCDGVFASSDVIAAGVIRAVHALGKRCPEDVKVIGFDGVPLFQLYSPSITTIRQPIEAISKYAIEYLLRQINGEDVPSQTILPVSMIKGESA